MKRSKAVILSERSESKELGTDLTAIVDEMRRSLDFARDDNCFALLNNSAYLRMSIPTMIVYAISDARKIGM